MMMMVVKLDINYHSYLEMLESISLLEIIYLFRDICFGLSVEDSHDCCTNCMKTRRMKTISHPLHCVLSFIYIFVIITLF